MGKQRSEQDQRRLVALWRQSGASAAAFAAREGISASSLFRWAHARGAEGATASGRMRLVEAIPTDPSVERAWAWEIATERGVVRGRSALDAAALRAVVVELVGSRASR